VRGGLKLWDKVHRILFWLTRKDLLHNFASGRADD